MSVFTYQRPRLLDRAMDLPPRWRRVDLVMLGTILVISAIGVVMVYSATRSGFGSGGSSGFAVRQCLWVGLGLVSMTAVAFIDYRRWQSWSVVIYGAIVLTLFIVLSPFGSSSKGAQSWFQIGGFQLQPSEFAKIALVIVLSAYASRQHDGLRGRHIVFFSALLAVPLALIGLQPDLGTAMVFAVLAMGILLVGGASWKAIGTLLAIGIVAAVCAVHFGVLKQYQLDRLGAFLNPTTNTEQSSYNLNQSKIAIGSGQVTGKGLFLGSQTNLRYVPEQHTDFIFTVVGEELGLVGSGTLLSLFAVLLWRMWMAAKAAPDRYGSLLCTGVISIFLFQIFENVGMTMGIMPITGIPLPLVSYGGSSVLACFFGLGLVLNVRFRGAS